MVYLKFVGEVIYYKICLGGNKRNADNFLLEFWLKKSGDAYVNSGVYNAFMMIETSLLTWNLIFITWDCSQDSE